MTEEQLKKEVNEQLIQTHYVRITVLNMDENESLGEIQGIVTSGNISVNGSSAIRRSGSLSLVAQEVNGKTVSKLTSVDNLISAEKRVKIEIGLANYIDPTQDSIIWYNQGVFVIGSASITHNNSGLNISVQLKDKMALLSGDIGGTLPQAMVHTPEVVEDDMGNYAKNNVKFIDIIRTLVCEWGGIPKEKVIIRDIPERISNTVRWVGGYDVKIENGKLIAASEANADYGFGDNIGYQRVDFTYPAEKELSSNAGDSITSVLDKIKNTLGNFEYFFDLDGNFIFQEIKNYLNNGSEETDLEEAIADEGFDYIATNQELIDNRVYNFEDATLVSAYTNNPQYSAIKNDINVWGIRSDSKAPIYYHIVIDEKPAFTPEEADEYQVYLYQDAVGVKRARPVKDGDDSINIRTITPNDWRTDIYFRYILRNESESIDYGKELKEYWPTVFDIENGYFYALATTVDEKGEIVIDKLETKKKLNAMTYFFDIIDPVDKKGKHLLQDIWVSKIGRRRKVLNDNNINCLFSPTFPNLFYIEAGSENTAALRKEALNEIAEGNAEGLIQVEPAMARNIAIGSAFNSAYDAMRSQIHEMIAYNETVSITILPLYYLEPNTVVSITHEDADIDGFYMIKSFSVPLTYNGTMSLQCTRVLQRI